MRLADELLEDHREWQVSPAISFQLDNLGRALEEMIGGLAGLRTGSQDYRKAIIEERRGSYIQRAALLRDFYEELEERTMPLDCESLINSLEQAHSEPWFTMLLHSKQTAVLERIQGIMCQAYSQMGQRPKYHEASLKNTTDEVLRQLSEGKVDRKLLQQIDKDMLNLYSQQHFGQLFMNCKIRIVDFVQQLLQSFTKVSGLVDRSIAVKLEKGSQPTYETELRDTIEDIEEPPHRTSKKSMRADLTTPMKLLASPYNDIAYDCALKSANRLHIPY